MTTIPAKKRRRQRHAQVPQAILDELYKEEIAKLERLLAKAMALIPRAKAKISTVKTKEQREQLSKDIYDLTVLAAKIANDESVAA